MNTYQPQAKRDLSESLMAKHFMTKYHFSAEDAAEYAKQMAQAANWVGIEDEELIELNKEYEGETHAK